MKILIWIGVGFVYAIVKTACAVSGIQLGGLPTILLLAALFFVAKKLCKLVGKK